MEKRNYVYKYSNQRRLNCIKIKLRLLGSCVIDCTFFFLNNNHGIETLKTVSKNILADIKVACI